MVFSNAFKNDIDFGIIDNISPQLNRLHNRLLSSKRIKKDLLVLFDRNASPIQSCSVVQSAENGVCNFS